MWISSSGSPTMKPSRRGSRSQIDRSSLGAMTQDLAVALDLQRLPGLEDLVQHPVDVRAELRCGGCQCSPLRRRTYVIVERHTYDNRSRRTAGFGFASPCRRRYRSISDAWCAQTRGTSTPLRRKSGRLSEVSRRDQIKLSEEELLELLDGRAGRDRLQPRPARLAALDADVVRPARRRDLDLDLRQVAEGAQPRTRPAGDGPGRDRARVRRAARSDDRGRGGDPPRLRDRARLRRRADRCATRRGSPRSTATPRPRSRRRRRSASRSTSSRFAPRPGITASWAGPTEPLTSWRYRCRPRVLGSDPARASHRRPALT